MISTFTAFFDANVFFGARLRSIIITLAQSGLFRARWSEDVHREWMQAVLGKRRDLTLEKLEPTRRAMDNAVDDCLVTNYERLIAGLTLPDPDDRHVLAAAIAARSSVIVTFNIGDFPVDVLDLYGIHAKHPDDFILDLESLDPFALINAVGVDLRHYANPPLKLDEYLDDLRRAGVPKTVDHLVRMRVLIEHTDTGSSPPADEAP
jgi:predicted nucleic acid-binding protein